MHQTNQTNTATNIKQAIQANNQATINNNQITNNGVTNNYNNTIANNQH